MSEWTTDEEKEFNTGGEGNHHSQGAQQGAENQRMVKMARRRISSGQGASEKAKRTTARKAQEKRQAKRAVVRKTKQKPMAGIGWRGRR